MPTSRFDRLLRFVLRVEFIAYAVLGAIGVAVLWFTAQIGLDVLRHGSLIPPPLQAEQYRCSAAVGDFSLLYLRGVDRLEIKSAAGSLEGHVQGRQLDWQGFATDRSLLGFAPPSAIAADDGKTLRLAGADLQDAVCVRLPAPGPRPPLSASPPAPAPTP